MAASPAEPRKARPTLAEAPTAPAPDAHKLAALLQFEAEIRRQSTVNELQYLIANDARALVSYGQMFVLQQKILGEGFSVACASSLATIDRNAPLIQALERLLEKLNSAQTLDTPRNFNTAQMGEDEALDDYPYSNMRWQPLLSDDGQAFGGLLVAREEPLRDGETKRLERIADTGSHAWRALKGNKPIRRLPGLSSTKKTVSYTHLTLPTTPYV